MNQTIMFAVFDVGVTVANGVMSPAFSAGGSGSSVVETACSQVVVSVTRGQCPASSCLLLIDGLLLQFK